MTSHFVRTQTVGPVSRQRSGNFRHFLSELFDKNVLLRLFQKRPNGKQKKFVEGKTKRETKTCPLEPGPSR